jgi:hypothetical protein
LASNNQDAFAPGILNTRAQLTLFAAGSVAEGIEEVRKVLDPAQFNLIAAYVTLCREDELEGLIYWLPKTAMPKNSLNRPATGETR